MNDWKRVSDLTIRKRNTPKRRIRSYNKYQMAISPARLAAYDILLKIELGNGSSSELLAESAEVLGDRDRTLCHELTLGTIRRQMFLDAAVAQKTKKQKMDIEVVIALRLGLYQLLFLDRVPDYSAINDSVELVRRAKKTSAKGFVNAILRRFTREKPDLAFADEIERISIETSHPRWLLEKWIGLFGFEMATSIAWANGIQPPTAFRPTARARKLGVAIEDGIDSASFNTSRSVADCYLTDRMPPELRRLEEEHLIYFQDEASQMVGSLVNLYEGHRILDVCASPGSKTGQIRAAGLNGANPPLIVAGDISRKRAEFLKRNTAAQGLTDANVLQYDAETELPFADGVFDVILVDAPCSGTGTIRHNPEIRYRLTPDDFALHANRQKRILSNAARVLSPTGVLIYSTCSLETEENEEVVNAFLDGHSDFKTVRPRLPEAFITERGFARTFPSRDDMDGFFVAVLTRQGNN